jgi:hypothetical protein
MKEIIEKIERSLEIIDPVVVLVLGALHLAGVLESFQTWEPIVMVALGAVSALAGIWTVAGRKK